MSKIQRGFRIRKLGFARSDGFGELQNGLNVFRVCVKKPESWGPNCRHFCEFSDIINFSADNKAFRMALSAARLSNSEGRPSIMARNRKLLKPWKNVSAIDLIDVAIISHTEKENLQIISKVLLTQDKGLLMKPPAHSRRRILSLLEREAKDITARSELYQMLNFGEHPAPRIAKNLKKVLVGVSVEEISQQLSKDKSKSRQWFYDRLKLMMSANRGLYKRSKDCAAYIIDSIAEVAGIDPYHIYARAHTYNMRQFVKRRMQWLLDKPGRLDNKEKSRVLAAVATIGKEENITASCLKEATKGTSLPTFYFIMNDVEWEEYEIFRKSAILIVNEIISFCLRDDFLGSLRTFVEKNYPRLLQTVESNSPDGYIDKLYDKFRQQVLDGNTCFVSYKVPLKPYLRQILKNILSDHCRKLKKKNNGPIEIPVSQLEREDSKWEFIAKPHEQSVEFETLLKVLFRVTRYIPSADDRRVLRTAILNVPFVRENKEEVDVKKARKALLRWAPKILQNLGEDEKKLPDELRELLYYYANSSYAKTRRSVLICSKVVKERGLGSQWLAKQLQVSESALGKLMRGNVFPKRETLESIRNHISCVKKLLGIPDEKSATH